jgi:hypothetical protein
MRKADIATEVQQTHPALCLHSIHLKELLSIISRYDKKKCFDYILSPNLQIILLSFNLPSFKR